MRAIACILACALSSIGQQRIAVLTYNIHHGEGTDAVVDLERIANAIRSADPDLVAVQEVDVRTARTGGVDQAREIARLTGLHAIFGRTIPYRGGLYGNALLSRWPVNGFVNHEAPFTPGREKRGVIEAVIDLPGVPGFEFFATHFDTTAADRVKIVAMLDQIVRDRPADYPLLLAGDLNDTPASATLAPLKERWQSATLDAPLLTFPSDNPARQIDFVLFRPADRWRVVEVRVLDEAVASDHRALLAIMELLPNSAGPTSALAPGAKD